jgi:hypothetical protein
MGAILSTIVLPAVMKGPGVFSRLLSAACEGIAGISAVGPPLHAFTISTTAHCGTLAWPGSRLRRLSMVSSHFPAKRTKG